MQTSKRLLTFFSLIIFLVCLYFVFSTSSRVRYWVDDFCSSILLRNNGYFNSQIIWWKSWTGRFSYIAFLDLFELFGPLGAKVLPIILFLTYLITSIAIFSFSFLLGVLFLSLTFLNSPNLIQVFYWMTGSLNYFAPFIVLNIFGLLLTRKAKKVNYAVSFLLMFVASGFSESFAVSYLLFSLFLVFVLSNTNLKDKKEKIKMVLFSLAGTVFSLIFMFSSPGNMARSSLVTHPSDVLDLVTKTFYYSKWYLIHLFYIKSFLVSLSTILLTAFVFKDKIKNIFAKPKLVILSGLIFIPCLVFLVVGFTYQAMNLEPPERVMHIVMQFMIYALIVVFIAISQITKFKINQFFLNLLVLINMALFVYLLSLSFQSAKIEIKRYASEFDSLEQTLVNSKNKSLEIKNIKSVGKLDDFKDNGGWVASCVAGYYKLDKIIVKD